MSKRRILIADDSKTALMMVQMILKRHSYDIITATDGRDAIAKAKQHQPDLILMDVMMPEVGGFDAVAAIRRDWSQDVPIIMVTTKGEAENVARGYECGCTDYITKPVDPTELLSKVERLIKKDEGGAHGA